MLTANTQIGRCKGAADLWVAWEREYKTFLSPKLCINIVERQNLRGIHIKIVLKNLLKYICQKICLTGMSEDTILVLVVSTMQWL